MDKSELISHTIQIAGEKYPVRLTQEERDIAALIEKEINDKIRDFERQYHVRSKQDLITMVLLTYAFDSKSNLTTDHLHVANSKVLRVLSQFSSLEEE